MRSGWVSGRLFILAAAIGMIQTVSASSIVFERPLPQASNAGVYYTNNNAGSNRANFSEIDYQDQGFYFLPGDEFTLSGSHIIDSLTVWGVANTPVGATGGQSSDPASEFEELNLYIGAAGGDLTWQSNTYTATREFYQPDGFDYYGVNTQTLYPFYKITFTGLNLLVPANTAMGFAVYPVTTAANPTFTFALHTSNAALTAASGTAAFDGADDHLRYYYYSGNNVFSYAGSVLTDSDVNVLITGTPVPEPSTFALLGLGAVVMVYFRRRAH